MKGKDFNVSGALDLTSVNRLTINNSVADQQSNAKFRAIRAGEPNEGGRLVVDHVESTAREVRVESSDFSTVNIVNGAKLIATDSLAVGQNTVNGQWDNAAEMVVSAGRVEAKGNASVGFSGWGILSIQDHSQLASVQPLVIGDSIGHGELRVSDTSTVQAENGIYLGMDMRSMGETTIEQGSVAYAGNSQGVLAHIVVAEGGQGDFENDGTLVAGELTIAQAQRSVGDMQVLGIGKLIVNGSITAGFDGTGTMDLHDSALVMCLGTSVVGSAMNGSGRVRVFGHSKYLVNDQLTVGLQGDGVFFVADDGELDSDQGTIGKNANSRGMVILSQRASCVSLKELLVGVDGHGGLGLSDASILKSKGGWLGSGTGLGVARIGAGATWDGTVDGGLPIFLGNPDLGGEGNLVVVEGGKVTVPQFYVEPGPNALAGGGTIDGNLVSSGNVRPGDDFADGSGESGTMSSGIGTLTVTDAYDQGTQGTLAVDLGASSGQNDVLAVGGAADLAGHLVVSAPNSLSYHSGDHFDVLTAHSISGQFDDLPEGMQTSGSLPSLQTGLHWMVDYHHDWASAFVELEVCSDVQVTGFTSSNHVAQDGIVDQSHLTITYTVAQGPACPFNIGIYQSADSQHLDAQLMNVEITDAADRTTGQHTKNVDAAFAGDVAEDYFLMAKADMDTHAPTRFAGGVFQAPSVWGATVFVFGTSGADSIALSSPEYGLVTVQAALGAQSSQTYTFVEGSANSIAAVHAHEGDDQIRIDANVQEDVLAFGGDGNDTFTATQVPQDAYYFSQFTYLDGGAGDDTYAFIGTNDGVMGVYTIGEAPNVGSDTIDFSRLDRAVNFSLADTSQNVTSQYVGPFYALVIQQLEPTGLENVIGTPFDDTITGNSRPNRIDGGGGNDHIHAGTGDATFIGGAGSNSFTGGPGNNTYVVDTSATGGATQQTVSPNGSSNTFSLVGGSTSLVASNGANLDVSNSGGGTLSVPNGGSPQAFQSIALGGGSTLAVDQNTALSTASLSVSGAGRIEVGSGGTMTLGSSSSFTLGAAATLIKDGLGTLSIGGTQHIAIGAVLTVNDGTTNITSDSGAVGVEHLTVNANAAVNFVGTEHLAALNIGPDTVVTLSRPVVNGAEVGPQRLLVLGALAIDALSDLDLKDNAMILHGGANALATFLMVEAKIATAFNNFNLDGHGIKSSAIQDPTLTALGSMLDYLFFDPLGSFDSHPVDLNDTIVKYTYTGDATLNGSVDDDDASLLGGNYDNGSTGGHHWFEGDFTHDGLINDDDVSLLAGNYGAGPMP